MTESSVSSMKKIDPLKNPLIGKIGKDVMINKKDLFVDLNYQRVRVPKGLIRTIALRLDWGLFGKIIVADMGENYPGGRYAIVDGGGRHLATLMRDDITKIPCLVYEVDSVEDAALMFYYLNTQRKNPTTVEKHISALAFGDETSCAVQRIITKYGLEVSKTQKNRGIQAVRKCKDIYSADPIAFEKCVELLSELCKESPVYQHLIQGISYIIRFCDTDNGRQYDRLRKRILKCGAKQFHLKATELESMHLKGDRMMAEGMLGIINKALHENQRFELLPANGKNGSKRTRGVTELKTPPPENP